MTLGEYIKELQVLARRKGLKDAELIVREDDEGNGYRQYDGYAEPVFIEADSGYFIESVYDKDEIKEYDIEAKEVILIG